MTPLGIRRVLIVDDDPQLAEVMAAVLRFACDEVMIVPTMAACQMVIRTRRFALIVLDLMLPDSRATDTLEAIPELLELVPRIVCVTGSEVSAHVEQRVKDKGAEAVIAKTMDLPKSLRALFS